MQRVGHFASRPRDPPRHPGSRAPILFWRRPCVHDLGRWRPFWHEDMHLRGSFIARIGNSLAFPRGHTARRGKGERDAPLDPDAGGRPAAAVRSTRERRPQTSIPASCRVVQIPCRGAESTMKNLVRSFIRDENGEDLIEYGLLAAFVAAVALVTIILDPIGIKGSLVGAFEKAKNALDAQ